LLFIFTRFNYNDNELYSPLVSIKVLPSLLFENLNSLETLNLQNNKLQRIPQDIMEPVIDTLRIIDITGKS